MHITKIELTFGSACSYQLYSKYLLEPYQVLADSALLQTGSYRSSVASEYVDRPASYAHVRYNAHRPEIQDQWNYQTETVSAQQNLMMMEEQEHMK